MAETTRYLLLEKLRKEYPKGYYDVDECEIERAFNIIDDFLNSISLSIADKGRLKMYCYTKPITERQGVCYNLALDALFTRDFNTAIHETVDVISDYNAVEWDITYGEVVLIKSIIKIFRRIIDSL